MATTGSTSTQDDDTLIQEDDVFRGNISAANEVAFMSIYVSEARESYMTTPGKRRRIV
jgi:hypothetical protein